MSSYGMSVLPNGFMGTIFRTLKYGEGVCFIFFVCSLLNGFMGTIFRTRDYGGVVFVLFLVCVTPNGYTGTIFRTRECVGSGVIFEKGCGVEKKQWVRRNRTHYL